MIDLNDAAPQIIPGAPPTWRREQPKHDYKALNERLQRDLSWVKQCFPNGRLSLDRKFWCLANWRGDAPNKHGSCRIDMTGDMAGHGTDFTTSEPEDPIGAIGRATGLSGQALYEEASRLAGMSVVVPLVQSSPKPKHDSGPEIERILSGARVLTGTIGEKYLATRGLRSPVTSDLLFHPDLIDYAGKKGYCGLVAVVKNGMGERVGGIHRTFLLEDGSSKALPGRKMLGPRKGGSIRLAPIGADGHIGVAEGIETALSATAIFGVPCWAGMDASGVAGWEWPPETKRVTIFADAGEAGQGAAQRLSQRLFDAQVPFHVRSPIHGDDFNDDLKQGTTEADYPEIVDDSEQLSLEACLSEDALALEFADRNKHQLRYVNDWKSWLSWDGKIWKQEKTLAAYDMVRSLCRQASELLGEQNKKQKSALRKAATVSAIEVLSRSDRRFATTPGVWDADDWLLNTPVGVIDLKTGENVGFDPKRYITKITKVAPRPGCPKWMAFLDRATNGDKDLQSFLKRMMGYSLTGSIREHALFFVYGKGGNGKGVFLNTLTSILGELHKGAPVETFAEKKHQAHPTEIARLAGARLVTASETEKGQHWAEARIKALTGGDTISARFMRGDFFEFQPKFKLIIVGNHKPRFRSVDDAIRRRLHLVPFDVNVSKEERNVNLADELQSEWGGILQWMIDGCLEWQQTGLSAPESVMSATSDYLESEDMVGQWMAQNCVKAKGFNVKNGVLFEDWKNWANAAYVAVGDQRMLAAEIETRHGKENRYMPDKVLGWRNLRLKTKTERDAETKGMVNPEGYYSALAEPEYE